MKDFLSVLLEVPWANTRVSPFPFAVPSKTGSASCFIEVLSGYLIQHLMLQKQELFICWGLSYTVFLLQYFLP